MFRKWRHLRVRDSVQQNLKLGSLKSRMFFNVIFAALYLKNSSNSSNSSNQNAQKNTLSIKKSGQDLVFNQNSSTLS